MDLPSVKMDQVSGQDIQHHERIDSTNLDPVHTQKVEQAIENERQMSMSEAARIYAKAISWSILLSTTVIMEGYDLLLVTSFFAFQPWAKKYGELQPDGTYQLSAAWQSGLYNGAAVGEILGLFLNGLLSERYGYRKTMLGALTAVIALIFIPFFAPTVKVLQAGSVLIGIPWGVFQTLPAAYASEICPVALRGYLTTYINLCWVIGQFLASGVLRAMLPRSDEWAYRIPYAIQWVWPLPILIGVVFAPESPWWLIRKNRKADAEKALRRLTSQAPGSSFNMEDTLAMMSYTNEMEKEVTSGTSYVDCFRGSHIRRTEITCAAWSIQNLCGTAFMNNSTYFFIQAGLNQSNSFTLSMGQYAIGFVGTIGAWFLMPHIGRRQIYLVGLTILDLLLLAIGFTGLGKEGNSEAQWAAGCMLLVFAFIYNLTVGSICYAVVSEMSSLRLRAKTIVLARNVYNVFSITNGVLTPYMLNPTAWNWKNKTGFFWAGICLLCLIWAFFRLPETKGRTYAEIDLLFEKQVSARRFKKTFVRISPAGNILAEPSNIAKGDDS